MTTAELRGPTDDLTRRVEEEWAHVAGLVDNEMYHFRTDVFSALLACKLLVTEAIDALADEVSFSTSGTAVDASPSHASFGLS